MSDHLTSKHLDDLPARRLWLFRLLALALLPLAFVTSEAVLRWVGVGYDPGFVVAGPTDGELLSNRQFGWRFFPPPLAREPVPFIVGPKPEGTLRVVVLGGSAAQGVPEPGFGLARQLEAQLEGTYPQQRFEVVNAAMTAINSHVVLPIARQTARLQPDLYVVYMGNNEVVGPYGAGTVFAGPNSSRHSSRRWIQLQIAATRSRGWQWIRAFSTPQQAASEWRGMEMFLRQQVAADDPRLDAAYRHFEANLRDIVATARDAGAEVVLSTVATNLSQQPPFASRHREGLSPESLVRWQEGLESALLQLQAGDAAAALVQFDELAQIDDLAADLHFHRGRALASLNRPQDAQEAFLRARDLDTLRFRADSKINDIIRRVATSESLPWHDAEASFLAAAVADGDWPGHQIFYEHVHLTFEGNVALAAALLPSVAQALELEGAPDVEAISSEDVARHLAFTRLDRRALHGDMLSLVERPPFSAQWGHRQDLQRRRREIQTLEESFDVTTWTLAKEYYRSRLDSHPDDLGSRERYSKHLAQQGETDLAIDALRHLIEGHPGVAAWQDALASNLSRQGRPDEARRILAAMAQTMPERRSEIWVNEAQILLEHGDIDTAKRLFEDAAAARPWDPVPRYNLSHLAIQQDGLDAAIESFRVLTEDFPEFSLGHTNLGVALARKGEFEASLPSFERAMALNPHHAPSSNSYGLALDQLGRPREAEVAYRRALEIDPGYALAAFNLADTLLSRGSLQDLKDAVGLYRQGLRQRPDQAAARQNLRLAEHRLLVLDDSN